MEQLQQQLNFILELDKLKAVYRQALIKVDDNRFENSAEHSWHIAMMALTFEPYAAEPVNMTRVLNMLLVHDIVEIDAGDTFAFGEQQDLDAQEAKELAAAHRIFGLLPEAQCQVQLDMWLEFERAETADARFAKAMDRILPLIQNMQNDGGSWARHQVKRSQVLARNRYLEVSAPKLWDYAVEQIELATKNGWLLDE